METLARILHDGGPVLFFLIGLSLASLTLIFWKALRLWPVSGGRARRAQALAAWAEGRRDQARALAAAGGAPADRLLAEAMDWAARGHAPAAIEAEMTRRGNEELARLSTGLRLLELIAMVSPLIGLLGTVLGMIRSFRELALAEGSANAAVLAGGIWEALLTTAAGLVVAIPAAVGAGLLGGRVEQAGLAMESAVGRFLMLTGAHGMPPGPPAGGTGAPMPGQGDPSAFPPSAPGDASGHGPSVLSGPHPAAAGSAAAG